MTELALLVSFGIVAAAIRLGWLLTDSAAARRARRDAQRDVTFVSWDELDEDERAEAED